jgi:hypothetical protein
MNIELNFRRGLFLAKITLLEQHDWVPCVSRVPQIKKGIKQNVLRILFRRCLYNAKVPN